MDRPPLFLGIVLDDGYETEPAAEVLLMEASDVVEDQEVTGCPAAVVSCQSQGVGDDLPDSFPDEDEEG